MDPSQQPQPAQFSQYQQQAATTTTTANGKPPLPHVSPKGMWVSKLIFRILSAIFSVVIIGLAAYLGTSSYGSYYGYLAASPMAIMLPAACVGFIWDVAEIICILARRGHRGIHPGAVVALDLILWLGFIATTVLYALFHLGDVFLYDTYWYEDDYEYGYGYGYDSGYDEMFIISRVLIALAGIEVAIHLLLFIFGCYETSIRNRRTPPVVYMPGPMGAMGQMPPMSHQPQHFSQYGAPPPGQPIMLPAGQAPPAGYAAYSYGPQDGSLNHQYPAPAVSPPPQSPSPIHTASTSIHGDWRNSSQPAPAAG